MTPSETIVAIATPPGSGGIGIIRVSGPQALTIATTLFQPHRTPAVTGGSDGNGLQSHRLYYGDIVDPRSRQRIDEVLLTVMTAPHTYTREDVLEIQAHSGATVLRAILALVINTGARLAEPGEFTRRAFLNGRIDLTQAEAVIDVINARSLTALTAATNQIHGELRNTIEQMRHVLTDLLVRIEAGIDFPEDVTEILPPAEGVAILEQSVIASLRELIRRAESSQVYREGLDLVIIGKPNVGKSSLMNRLLERDRVIVAPTPGTTRDVIEEGLNIAGVPVNLVDTAGIHRTDDPVERIGIERTGARIDGARMVLMVVDVSEALSAADHDIFQNYRTKTMVLVQNKIDRIPDGEAGAPIPEDWRCLPCVRISALHGTGVEQLKTLIVEKALGDGLAREDHRIIPNLRHRRLLEQGLNSAEEARRALATSQPPELTAIDIKSAIAQLNRIIGEDAGPDLIERIFNRFCIGK